MVKAYCSAAIQTFLPHSPEYILGVLAQHHSFVLEDLQKGAWLAQIELLKNHLATMPAGYLLFEYSIPRMGKRVDAILIINGIVIVIEFKVGATDYSADALDQVLDYALALKNFHEQSQNRSIVPILVATEAGPTAGPLLSYSDQVFVPLKANKQNLSQVLGQLLNSIQPSVCDPIAWLNSAYRPTPTIIEAAQALYSGHNVTEISRSDAGATNLSRTADAIAEIIDRAKKQHEKVICFVTGVPGAGKTLAGLNIANQRLAVDETEHAVFLSGNGPLVQVLREALARDEVSNWQGGKARRTKAEADSKVRTFVQNIHHFRDEALDSQRAPYERVAIFDEAQRAWTREQAASFMKRKRGVADFAMSEPQFLISVMSRHPDWAVIVCLVGGGQEINTGEAGLTEWFEAIGKYYADWLVYFAPNLHDTEYTRGQDLLPLLRADQVHYDQGLHLAVSLRSFRSENISGLVKALLDLDIETAKTFYRVARDKYPIALTRDLDKARQWLKCKARGTERYGILASSGGARLRPTGINVQAQVDVVNWFLNGKDDVRSSYYLEEVATEFDVQGLELDWTCVAWDADLRQAHGQWQHFAFRGTNWHHVNDPTRRTYLKNAYRVLLTRARQGMVILVPPGSDEDFTRKPEYYDATYDYLRQIGFEEI